MTEHRVPDQPTADTCFAEAAANLRTAEQMIQEALGHDRTADQVIYLADAWTRLGKALSDVEPFEFPIPVRLVGGAEATAGHHKMPNDSGPVPSPRTAKAHRWPVGGPIRPDTACLDCGINWFGPLGPECVPLSVTKVALVAPEAVEHAWNKNSGYCDNAGCRAHHMDRNIDLFPCPVRHQHSSDLCGHRWVAPMEPCRNGCGARPEDQPMDDASPWELCLSACPEPDA